MLFNFNEMEEQTNVFDQFKLFKYYQLCFMKYDIFKILNHLNLCLIIEKLLFSILNIIISQFVN
jgi:hypothetical protein